MNHYKLLIIVSDIKLFYKQAKLKIMQCINLGTCKGSNPLNSGSAYHANIFTD